MRNLKMIKETEERRTEKKKEGIREKTGKSKKKWGREGRRGEKGLERRILECDRFEEQKMSSRDF